VERRTYEKRLGLSPVRNRAWSWRVEESLQRAPNGWSSG